MSDPINRTPETTEQNDALKRFLSREQEDKQQSAKSTNSHRSVLIVIIAAVIVAALVMLLIFLRSRPAVSDDETAEPAALETSVSADGVHEAAVILDENGEIQHNGSGALLSYFPADISRIEVENRQGSFAVTSYTPEGEATVYTLEGFEGFALQAGIADDVANDAAALDFIQIISADGSLADFGLDSPAATVNVTYQDGTSARIRVGSEAAAEAGTYIAFGSNNAVYLVSNDAVDAFLYGVNEFISLDITDKVEDSENTDFSTLTVSGSHFPEPITIVPNTDEAIDASYLVTAPRRMVANATESFDIAGSIRGLYAEEVACVNPSAGQLADYGMAEPYASVTASYADGDITLHASSPGDDGRIYIFNPDKNVIYTIQLAAASWARTSVEALTPESILSVKQTAVSRIVFSADGKSYTIDVNTVTQTVDTEDGGAEDVITTTASYDGTELTAQNFGIFFQNLTGIRNQGEMNGGGSEVLRFTLSYSTGRADDTVTVYHTGNAKYAVSLNGEPVGSATKAYIDSLIRSADTLVTGGNLTSL